MRAIRQMPALAVMLLIVVMLAGCVGAASAQPNVSAPRGGPFTSLRAVRQSGLATQLPTFDHTGTDADAIERLFDAIVALKPFQPNASYHCPNDQGILYTLTFTRANGSTLPGFAKPDGCEYASLGNNPYGQIVDTAPFWSLFAVAVGAPCQRAATQLVSEAFARSCL